MIDSLVMEKHNKQVEKRKVVIIGGFGWQDIGDEAMPQAVIYNLRRTISNLEIVMLSPQPTYTTKYHKERSIHDVNAYLNRQPWLISKLTNRRLGIVGKIVNKFYSRRLVYFSKWLYFLIVAKCHSCKIKLPLNKMAKEILNELASADLLFNNGGGNINTLLSGELYKQTLTILAASILKIPVILSGQTIGPITKKIHSIVVKLALNKVDTITLRDRCISSQRLRQIGVDKPVIKDTADDAIGLPFLQGSEVNKLISENNGDGWQNLPAKIIAVMNMNGYLKAMDKDNIDEFDKEVELLSRIADRLVKTYGAKILLVPTDYNSVSDDRPLLIQIKKSMKYKETALVIGKEYDAIQYKSLIGLGDIAIGVRYHFAVFATSMGVPCIGLANGVYQKAKLKGVMELYGLQDFFIAEDMVEVELDKIWSVVENVIENRRKISLQLKARTQILQRNSLMTIFRAADILKN